MGKQKKRIIFIAITNIFTLLILLLMPGCNGEEVTPEFPRPNPAMASASPVILSGDVYNSQSSAKLDGATVDIYGSDGSKLTSVFSGANGKFSYDISNAGEASYKLVTTASGYGSSFKTVAADVTNKSIKSVSIPIDKLESVSGIIHPVGNDLISITSKESKDNQMLTLQSPAEAVTQNTSVQLAIIPVNNVATPQNSSGSTCLCVGGITPAGITFSKPLVLTFPLPYKNDAGSQLVLYEYVNNAWQPTSSIATVDNSGYLASANISNTGTFALFDNTLLSGNVTLDKNSKVSEQRSFTFSSGTLEAELPGVITYQTSSQNIITEAPSDEWIFNTLAQRFGADFSIVSAPGSFPESITFNVAWPGAAGNPYKANADGSGNINRPGESGSWSLKVVFESYSETFANVELNNPGHWQITVNGSISNWKVAQTVWVWTSHDQGAVIEY